MTSPSLPSNKCPTCGHVPKKWRSNSQNSYYWSVCVGLISEHTGFTPDETHEILKNRFLSEPKTLQLKTKTQMVFVTRSTTELDTKSFEEYLSKIRIFASMELGIWIPEPNEQINS